MRLEMEIVLIRFPLRGEILAKGHVGSMLLEGDFKGKTSPHRRIRNSKALTKLNLQAGNSFAHQPIKPPLSLVFYNRINTSRLLLTGTIIVSRI